MTHDQMKLPHYTIVSNKFKITPSPHSCSNNPLSLLCVQLSAVKSSVYESREWLCQFKNFQTCARTTRYSNVICHQYYSINGNSVLGETILSRHYRSETREKELCAHANVLKMTKPIMEQLQLIMVKIAIFETAFYFRLLLSLLFYFLLLKKKSQGSCLFITVTQCVRLDLLKQTPTPLV